MAGSGCVGPHGYFTDRWRDAKDVFTASVGTGGGAKARVGPMNAGLFLNSDAAGLRGGEFFYAPGGSVGPLGDIECVVLLVYSIDCFDLRPQAHLSSVEPRLPCTLGVGNALANRSKCFQSFILPLLAFEPPEAPYYYTQLEVAAGVGGTLRLGFNPGELLDFILGWANLDVFGDDLEAGRERQARRKAREKPEEAAASPALNGDVPATPAPPAAP